MTVTAAKPQARAGSTAFPSRERPGAPAAATPSPRRRQIALTPMRQDTAKSLRKLAAHVQGSHPDMSVHQHLRDAARTLESGNEEAAQRHLRAAMFALTPQSLLRNGVHDDAGHLAAREAMHGVHRHLLLVKDITDAGEKNRAAIARHAAEDMTTSPPPPAYGGDPGALAQRPVARQPGGDRALNAPDRTNSGGSDPAVADPVGPQPRGSKQFSYGWDDLAAVAGVIALTGDGHGNHIPGTPDEWRHGYIPLTEAAARSHGHGKVPKGWHAPAGRAAAAKGGTPGYVKDFKHPGTAAEDAKMRQAVKAEDYDTAAKHLQAMDRLEKRAGVGEAGPRPKIAGTVDMVKSLKQAKQREAKALPNERGKAAERIADTAKRAISADPPVRTSLREASNSLYRADHPGTLRHLAEAKAASKGTKINGQSAERVIAAHEKEVRQLADQAQALAKHAPKGYALQAANSWDDLAAVVELSAETARLAVTPAPYGKPGGPGLYNVKGLKHSDYEEQIVKALMRKGMDKGKATAIARGSIRRWMRGGGKVHPEVRAAAAGAEAEELKAQARAHAHAVSWDDVASVVEMAAAAAVPGQQIAAGQPATAAKQPPSPAKSANATAQPRVGAGSPAGGQFAPAGSGSSSKPMDAHQKHVAHLQHLVNTGKASPAKPAVTKAPATVHQAHVAHVAHLQHLAAHGNPAQQKAAAAVLARMGVKA